MNRDLFGLERMVDRALADDARVREEALRLVETRLEIERIGGRDPDALALLVGLRRQLRKALGLDSP